VAVTGKESERERERERKRERERERQWEKRKVTETGKETMEVVFDEGSNKKNKKETIGDNYCSGKAYG
jgi:predicted fused transcriptional regulator/phosphomethylpyrimidine kinase